MAQDEIQAAIQEAMAAATNPLLEKRAQLVQQKQELVQELEWVRSGLTQVDKFLKAAGVPIPGVPKKPQAASSSIREFEDKVLRITPIIVAQGGEWTSSRVREQFQVSGSTAANILERLRRDDVLRLAGTKSGRGGEHRVYRLFDDVELVDVE